MAEKGDGTMADNKNLKDGAYTGSLKDGNPYEGDLAQAIAYDRDEINFPVVEEYQGSSIITTGYHAGARRLASLLPKNITGHLLEVGSGTGIATLEMLLQHKGVSIMAIEKSEGMRQLAQYKFGAKAATSSIASSEPSLKSYWDHFREQAKPYRKQVQFRQSDIEQVKLLRKYDGAFANQVMHWTELSESMLAVNENLKEGAPFVWSSASHFYNDATYPTKDFGLRHNASCSSSWNISPRILTCSLSMVSSRRRTTSSRYKR
jgi:SAM-dependent methyltransferase